MSFSTFQDVMDVDFDRNDEFYGGFQDFDLPLISTLSSPDSDILTPLTALTPSPQPQSNSIKQESFNVNFDRDLISFFNQDSHKKASEFQQLTGLRDLNLDFGFKEHFMEDEVPGLNDLPELIPDTPKPVTEALDIPIPAQFENFGINPSALLQLSAVTQPQPNLPIRSAPVSPAELIKPVKEEEETRAPRAVSEPSKTSVGRYVWANPRNPNAAILDMITEDPQRYTYPPTDLPAVPLRGLSPFDIPTEKKPTITLKGYEYLEEEFEPRLQETENMLRKLILSRANRTLRNTIIDDLRAEEFLAPASSSNRFIKSLPKSSRSRRG